MHDPLAPSHGCVMSADIAVPEHAREVQFYVSILGTGESPLWRADLMNNLGMPIIGLGERIPEYESLPLAWMPHIQVDDVAASVEAALASGGKELMHGKDDDGRSLWAVLFDPNGTAFGLMPVVSEDTIPKAEDGTMHDPSAPMGHITHLSLIVPDAAATSAFYRKVVGWSTEEIAMEDGGDPYSDHLLADANGRPVASIRHARGEHQGLPGTWLLHLPVADLEESLRRVEAGGGKVLSTAQVGRDPRPAAVIQDPVGVVLALEAG